MKKLIDSIERVKSSLGAGDRWDPRIRVRSGPRFAVEGRRVLLVYLFERLGDLVLLAPVVKALAMLRPKAVGLVLPPLGVRLFKAIDFGDAKIELLRSEAFAASKRRYDVAIDLTLREGSDGRAFLKASKAEVRLGWMSPGETLESAGLTFGTADLRHETLMHWSRYAALPLRPLGVEAPNFEVKFRGDAARRKKAAALWEKDRARILIVPGGRQAERRWDEARFIEVAAWAEKERDASIVLLGGPDESPAMRRTARAIGKAGGRRPRVYTGKDLGLLVELVASSHAVVTNDTGPMHVAFLLQKPTIAMFQYMSPMVWGPPKNEPRFVVLKASNRVDAGRDVWTQLVIRHLDAQVAWASADSKVRWSPR